MLAPSGSGLLGSCLRLSFNLKLSWLPQLWWRPLLKRLLGLMSWLGLLNPTGLRVKVFGRRYIWVFGHTSSGKRVLVGPFTDEVDAEEVGGELDEVQYFKLKTRSQQKATGEVRALLLKQGYSPDGSLKRQLHSRGLEREGVSLPAREVIPEEESVFGRDPFTE